MTARNPAWLTVALKDVGYREGPNNDNKFGRALGLNHVPWCDLAVTRWCQIAKHPLPPMQPGMSTGAASVWYSMQFAKAHGLWRPSWEARPGDQIVYGWNGPGSAPADMHTGLIVHSGPAGSTGRTVEGNRHDQVGRFNFTVGEDVVLGTIALTKLLLGRERVIVTAPKPDPQPRHPDHPTNTGPAASHPPVKAKPHRRRRRTAAKTQAAVAKRYSKALGALIGGVGTWLGVALADGQVTPTEWKALALALAPALTAYLAPKNAPKSTTG